MPLKQKLEGSVEIDYDLRIKGSFDKGRFIMSKSSGNRNNGEDAFREWLSDHLRYLVLLIALLLAVVVIIMTVSLMDNRQGSLQAGAGDNPDAVVIMSETAAVEIRETQSEAASESGQIAEAESETKAETKEQPESEEAAPETETKAKEEAETEKKDEAETEAKEEAETEKKEEAETEAKEKAETEKKEEAETEAKEKAETEAKEKTETEKKEEVETEARKETETEKKKAAETKAKTEARTKEDKETETEAETEKAVEEKTSQKTDRKTGKTTTSSTEKTVKAPSRAGGTTESAALAGFGAETEKESSTDSGTITVTSSAGVNRITALVSGGSSSAGNRASVTNIDTGTTIGTYHNSGSNLNASAGSSSISTQGQTGDTDNSGGLVSVGGSDQGWEEPSYDGSGDIEIVGQETPETAPSPTYRTIVSACNIRSYPDYGDNVIGGLGGGETVLFYGEEAGWYKIEYNGIVGYIGPRFLQ